MSVTVMSSALWLCQTWLLTRRQRSHFCSWGARMGAHVARTRRSPTEDIGHYWRRLHRYGHGLLRVPGGSLDARRKLKLHSYAGHIARSTSSIINLPFAPVVCHGGVSCSPLTRINGRACTRKGSKLGDGSHSWYNIMAKWAHRTLLKILGGCSRLRTEMRGERQEPCLLHRNLQLSEGLFARCSSLRGTA